MRRVIIESPYAGNWWQRYCNRRYARACLKDAIDRSEVPMASHLLYTQVLDDRIPKQRELGILIGQRWFYVVDALVVYVDRGITSGMMQGIDLAEASGLPIEYRSLDPDAQPWVPVLP